MIVLEGTVEVDLDDQTMNLSTHDLVLIPRGALRRIVATSERAVYLNVHKRRAKLGLGSTDAYHSRAKP